MILRRVYFSLLEMMVVIAIIGFLAGIMVVKFTDQADYAAVESTKATIRQVSDALKMYNLAERKYPSTDEGLQLLVTEGKLDSYPMDAWKRKLNYQYPGTSDQPFDLWSTGADGLDAGEKYNADIYNRPEEQKP